MSVLLALALLIELHMFPRGNVRRIQTFERFVVIRVEVQPQVMAMLAFSDINAMHRAKRNVQQLVAAHVIGLKINKHVHLVFREAEEILVQHRVIVGFDCVNTMGCFMNMLSIVYIMTPIFLPICQSFGMHAVTFGIMMILNLGIGLLTPPVGQVLFVGSSVSGISVERLSKAMLPQMMFMVIALLLVTFIPALTLWLPTVLGYV